MFQQSPFFGYVLTLLSGNLIAQVAQFILTIFIARLFSVDDRGLFAIYGSVLAFSVSIAALRYDMAIVLPKSDDFARLLERLSLRAIMITSAVTSVVCILLSHWFLDKYGSTTLVHWLWFSGIAVFLVAQVTNIQYWLTRQSRFKDIAINRIVQSLTTAGSQLLLGLVFGPSLSILIIGTLLGQLLTLVSLELRVKELWKPIPRPYYPMRKAAATYWRMPAFNGPNTLIDSLREMGITLLIGLSAVSSLGQFNLASTAMQVPVGLIAGSIAQVFYKKMATIQPGKMTQLVKYTITRGLLVSIPPFVILYFLCPWLFPFVFGAKWLDAGTFAQALIPWLTLRVVTSPISGVFVVTGTQLWMLAFSIPYATVPLAWLALSPMSLVPTIYVLSGLMAVMMVIMLAMAIAAAKRYDRANPNPKLAGE